MEISFHLRTTNRIGQSDKGRRFAVHDLSLHVDSVTHNASFVVMSVMTSVSNDLESDLYLAPIRQLCCHVVNFQDDKVRHV